MRTIGTIFHYLLILFCCLVGAYLAGKIAFPYELIFLAYVAMTTYAIVEIIFLRFALLKDKIRLLRAIFLAACIISTYALLVTTEKMILKKELSASWKELKITDIDIKSKSIGYLVNIKFAASGEQFVDLATTLGFKETNLLACTFSDEEMKKFKFNLINKENTVICFEKNENISLRSFGTRYLIYDSETMTAYYEYLNHKGVYN